MERRSDVARELATFSQRIRMATPGLGWLLVPIGSVRRVSVVGSASDYWGTDFRGASSLVLRAVSQPDEAQL